LTVTAVDIRRGEVEEALMVTPGVVIIDELSEAGFQAAAAPVALGATE